MTIQKLVQENVKQMSVWNPKMTVNHFVKTTVLSNVKHLHVKTNKWWAPNFASSTNVQFPMIA